MCFLLLHFFIFVNFHLLKKINKKKIQTNGVKIQHRNENGKNYEFLFSFVCFVYFCVRCIYFCTHSECSFVYMIKINHLLLFFSVLYLISFHLFIYCLFGNFDLICARKTTIFFTIRLGNSYLDLNSSVNKICIWNLLLLLGKM